MEKLNEILMWFLNIIIIVMIVLFLGSSEFLITKICDYYDYKNEIMRDNQSTEVIKNKPLNLSEISDLDYPNFD